MPRTTIDQSTIQEFFDSECVFGPEYRAGVRELFDAYKWFVENRRIAWQNQRERVRGGPFHAPLYLFELHVADHAVKRKRSDAAGKWFWYGIGLKEDL